ncbi:hypothetical protein [Rubritalea sp.]|uniref:hypothetical protein n=1 Tax=Rubritalea sp. TaxID=2109375 RepID=UPI003EF51B6E
MSTVLRAVGSNFDVDSFIKDTSLKVIKSFRKGEARTKRIKALNKFSGLNIDVSDADFDNIKQQIEDTVGFLQTHQTELASLRDSHGAEFISIDFGADIYPPGWCNFSFPHELLLLAGELRIDLDLSVYPTDPDEVEGPELTLENKTLHPTSYRG